MVLLVAVFALLVVAAFALLLLIPLLIAVFALSVSQTAMSAKTFRRHDVRCRLLLQSKKKKKQQMRGAFNVEEIRTYVQFNALVVVDWRCRRRPSLGIMFAVV